MTRGREIFRFRRTRSSWVGSSSSLDIQEDYHTLCWVEDKEEFEKVHKMIPLRPLPGDRHLTTHGIADVGFRCTNEVGYDTLMFRPGSHQRLGLRAASKS